MKAFEDKALAVSADMADALADGGDAATAVGCPPYILVVAPLYIALHKGRIFLILVKPLNSSQ
ncbi:putative phage associated protein [Neisseria lactamica]|nr:putative phage associated protein [Neisseria lactamica]